MTLPPSKASDEVGDQPATLPLWRMHDVDATLHQRIALRHGIWVGFVVYLLFAITDILLVGDVAYQVVTGRLIGGVGALAVFEYQFRRGANLDRLNLSCAALLVAAFIAWLVPTMMSSHTENLSYYLVFGAIFMMSANLFFRFKFLLSIVTSTIILAIIFVALMLFPADANYKIAFGTFYISCFAFTSYVNWNLNNERRNVHINAREAKAQHKAATERGEALLRLSRTDPLTGLENRRAVDERLRNYWKDWQSAGKNFAAILIDVDFFKKFNDRYGHQDGDRCLVIVGNALVDAIKEYDATIGRYGGEEFIVLAPLQTQDGVLELSEKIRRTVELLGLRHESRRDGVSVVTVSVGAAITRRQVGAKLEKIVHEADRALYLSKASGRNCVRLFDPNDPDSNDESENIAALLRIAVNQSLVSLVYQPIEDTRTGAVVAMEALMRLTMPDGTAVPPSLFIPVAERTGDIIELGRWAMRTACDELLIDDHVHVVSVNVSPVQLKMPGFAASVAAVLAEKGINGKRLAFEITEGLEMEMHSDVLGCIGDLKQLGIRIWLDDFGTGFAGLSWLRLIDFDTVKIDRSFLHDASTARGEDMLRDIVSLVRNRGHRLLVEGVETTEQLELMRDLDIDLVQGYFVGRPVPVQTIKGAVLRSDGPLLQSA